MGVNYNPRTVTDGLVLLLDAGNPKSSYKNFIKAKVFSVFNGSSRSANYSVQYSDDNTNWTTAFSGVCSNNTSCGIQENTGLGSGSYGYRRYWRYVEGSAVVLHHPRVSRIILTDVNGVDYNLIVYTSDNCSDTGTYVVGTVSVDFATTIWTDLSGRGNNGTLTNGPTYNSANGGSIVFDGTNDNIQLGNASNFISASQSTFTINSWVKTNVTGVYKKIFVTATAGTPFLTGLYLSLGPSPDIIYLGVITNNGTAYASSSSSISTSQYFNLCGTYDGSNIKLYLNGTLVATQAQTGNIVNTGIARISGYDNNEETWNGNIAQVSIYNRALSSQEISQNFNALRGRFGI